MEFHAENFIGIWRNAFSDEYCDAVINYFEEMKSAGFSKDRQTWQNTARHHKEDDAVATSFEDEVRLNTTKHLNNQFIDTFYKLADNYVDQFSVLTMLAAQPRIYTNKIQKTRVGGGYHIWHCENMDRQTSNRLFAYILYLNDVEEGGETEFLYTPQRIKPEKGTLLLFPAGFTHTHRGNPPISNEKYILTGWLEQ